VVAELCVSDFARSLAFYTDTLGFALVYSRPEERFAYLSLAGAELMIEETVDPARKLVAGELEYPRGRGVNLQIDVDDLDLILRRLVAAGDRIFLPLEERWYRRDDHEVGNRQFVALDPDGYLLRFAQDLGRRAIAAR
jgi:catechol 2,3-dioxygenase-like lactoylglutathione lyase family enzyme